MDPRDVNCQAVKTDAAGKVVGVELKYESRPDTKYQLVQAKLIDENNAGGSTVAYFHVFSKDGVEVAEPVYLAWPYPDLSNRTATSQNNQHMITNGYLPPNIGPLALFVGDNAGNVCSDVVGGLGLPWNRHVSFYCVWKERGAPDGNGDTDVAHLHDDLHKLAAHLGLEL